jgi:hypothetical protein
MQSFFLRLVRQLRVWLCSLQDLLLYQETILTPEEAPEVQPPKIEFDSRTHPMHFLGEKEVRGCRIVGGGIHTDGSLLYGVPQRMTLTVPSHVVKVRVHHLTVFTIFCSPEGHLESVLAGLLQDLQLDPQAFERAVKFIPQKNSEMDSPVDFFAKRPPISVQLRNLCAISSDDPPVSGPDMLPFVHQWNVLQHLPGQKSTKAYFTDVALRGPALLSGGDTLSIEFVAQGAGSVHVLAALEVELSRDEML